MTHSHIQDNDVRDRYVTGRLSDEERLSFEEHLCDCYECLDEVEARQRFRRGLRTTLTEDALKGVALRAGIRAWFLRGERMRRTALSIAMILLVFIPATMVYVIANRRASARLSQAQAALATLQLENSGQQRAIENLKEQARVAQGRQDRGVTLPSPEPLRMEMPASLPLFTLDRVREPDEGSPADEISISRSSRWLILLLEVEQDPDIRSYRSKLLNENEQLIWNADNLKLSRRDAIAVLVSKDLFKPGNYVLKLEGCDRQHHCYSVATYSFRATIAD